MAFSFLLREVPFVFVYFPFYLFFLALSLHCICGLSPVAASGGYSLAVVHRLLIAVASLVENHRLQ